MAAWANRKNPMSRHDSPHPISRTWHTKGFPASFAAIKAFREPPLLLLPYTTSNRSRRISRDIERIDRLVASGMLKNRMPSSASASENSPLPGSNTATSYRCLKYFNNNSKLLVGPTQSAECEKNRMRSRGFVKSEGGAPRVRFKPNINLTSQIWRSTPFYQRMSELLCLITPLALLSRSCNNMFVAFYRPWALKINPPSVAI